MVRRTYESDAAKIEDVDDLDDLVADKRVAWRACLLYTSPSPRDGLLSRMPSSA